jgi:hypothetical protein
MKDQIFTQYKIKIRQVRERKKLADGIAYRDKMFLIDVLDNIGGGIGFSVKCGNSYRANLRKVFRRICEELHLN